ncbi:MAG: TRAP transporter large permease, partial [Limnobacter sp.]|nr:TRAP transporter large permease [Limnobacter sp.]
QSLRERGSLNDVMAGSAPFVVAMLATIALLAMYPGIAMWLPGVIG